MEKKLETLLGDLSCTYWEPTLLLEFYWRVYLASVCRLWDSLLAFTL